ncbi:MAG: DUF4956 domain-containing protein [Bacteroidales bacterium]|nr:DUF4956 domain-containing protein [Candidatus Liminaster caballi]
MLLFDLIKSTGDELAEMAGGVEEPIINNATLLDLLSHFGFNLVFVLGIIYFLYFRRSRRADYFFTFALISISIFLMIFLLGAVKIKIGFALGLFAIFGIIRYRTESMPVREMTYLFVIISMSVINALAISTDWITLTIVNVIFVLACILGELVHKLPHNACKYVKYDRIDLITPARYDEMVADLEARLGVKIIKVDVGTVNFLKDMTLLKVYYEPTNMNEENTVDEMSKIPN